MGSVTIGGNAYDIYGTSDGADDYLAAKIGATAWAAATADTRAQGLVSSTRLIRAYLAGQGHDLDPAEPVDIEIEQANYELAYALVVNPALADQTNTNGNQRRVKAGSAEVEYFRPTQGGRFPAQVMMFLNGWLSGQGGTFSAAGYQSGACERSTIDGDDYALTEGY